MSECNCPDLTRMHPNEVVGTKPPCPVHDTPEKLAQLSEVLMPRIEWPTSDARTFPRFR